jgi:predicted nucleotidyltransferase
MNEARRWLSELARQNATVYTGHPSAQAFMITGSVARGEADRCSDLSTYLINTAPCWCGSKP